MKRNGQEPSERFHPLTVFAVSTGLFLGAFEVWRLLFRNGHLFAPDRTPLRGWNPSDYGLRPEMVDQLEFEAEDGMPLHGWYCRAENAVASVLFCHGNSANLTKSAPVVPFMNAAGLNVMLFDYRGFGRSGGRPTLTGVLRDAHAAARLHDELRPENVPSILYGYSLGGAIAAETATRHPFDGLILQSTFTNLADMARVRYPNLPMHLLSGKAFDTLKIIQSLNLPTVVIHGGADEVIPCWMGRRLYAACRQRHALHVIHSGLHNDLYEREGETIGKLIVEFASSLRPNGVVAPPPRRSIAAQVTKAIRRAPPLRPTLEPAVAPSEAAE
jgi:fermentation-respiration switch protein FrsA (DUF1100 family)